MFNQDSSAEDSQIGSYLTKPCLSKRPFDLYAPFYDCDSDRTFDLENEMLVSRPKKREVFMPLKIVVPPTPQESQDVSTNDMECMEVLDPVTVQTQEFEKMVMTQEDDDDICGLVTAACTPVKVTTNKRQKKSNFKAAIKKRANEQPPPPAPKKKGSHCEHCGEFFEKPQALGGHISKKHPGASKIYHQKMVTRMLRKPDRDALDRAKQIILEVNPNFDFG
jgi:hypothetical protein